MYFVVVVVVVVVMVEVMEVVLVVLVDFGAVVTVLQLQTLYGSFRPKLKRCLPNEAILPRYCLDPLVNVRIEDIEAICF